MDNILGALTLWLILCLFAFFLTVILHLLLDGKLRRIVLSVAEMLVPLLLSQQLMDHLKYHNRAYLEKPVVILLIAKVIDAVIERVIL